MYLDTRESLYENWPAVEYTAVLGIWIDRWCLGSLFLRSGQGKFTLFLIDLNIKFKLNLVHDIFFFNQIL